MEKAAKSLLILCIGFGLTGTLRAQTPAAQSAPLAAASVASLRSEVRALLEAQRLAWNRGDLDGFMSAYWHSDSLRFVTRSGLLLGYDSLAARYRRTYQADGRMGSLGFDLLRIDALDATTALVIGRWSVSGVPQPGQGHFTLLVRRIGGQWRIVLDHTS